jgi:uncharacterized protein DUF6680
MGIPLQSWLSILAIITGPTAALLIGKYLEELRAKRNRKIRIFQDLMANRASRLSPAWVQALNGIETEFYGQTKVIEAWRVVIDHLYSDDANDAKKVDQWLATLTDSVNDMLYEMAESLGYHFDKVTIKRNAYNPRLWGEVELENHAVRKKFLELLDGKRRLPVATFEDTFPVLTDQGPITPIKK